jgi:hypothetical protein
MDRKSDVARQKRKVEKKKTRGSSSDPYVFWKDL